MSWTAMSLWSSTRRVSSSRSSYSSSKSREVRNIVPYSSQKSLLFQVEHQGMTVRALHQVNLMFSGLTFSEKAQNQIDWLPVKYKGKTVWASKPSLTKTALVCRCSCPDFYFTFSYWNWKNKAIFGPKPRAYRVKGDRGPRNPGQHPGFCKHIANTFLLFQTHRWVK